MTIAYMPAMAFADSESSGDAEDIIAEDTQELPVDESDLVNNAAQARQMNLNEAQTGDNIASGTCGTCDWVIDANGNLIVSEGELNDWKRWSSPEWETYKSSIISFSTTGVVKAPTCYSMFEGYSKLVSADLSQLDTSEANDMESMFRGCVKIQELDLSKLDTSNVTNMSYMFEDCESLSSLNVSGFDTSKVTDMHEMFYRCSSLTQLNVNGFVTSSVRDMNRMFYGCSSLTQLNVNGFDTTDVTDMSYMFSGCTALKTLDLSNFNTSKVTEMDCMFNGCMSLEVLDVSNFDTSGITSMGSEYIDWTASKGMFSVCSSLVSLDLSSFDTSNVTNMGAMFYGCTSLQTLNLSSFDTSKVTDMSGMFCNCKALRNIELSNFDTSNVTTMRKMFKDCSTLSSVDLSSFDTSNVTNMEAMFSGDEALKSVVFSNSFKTSSTESMEYMFNRCKALTQLDVSMFDTGNVTNMLGMFQDCTALKTLDLSNFNTSKVTYMGNMFNGCTSLEVLDVSNFDTSGITEMGSNYSVMDPEGMFSGCSSLVSLDLSSFDTSNVTNMGAMFCDCVSLQTLNLSSFDTSKVTDMSGMFCNCRALRNLDISNFDTSNVTVMRKMFMDCRSLSSVNLSSFNTSKVSNMMSMFMDCGSLSSVDLSGFNTSKVENMLGMFSGCNSLVSLDLSSFDTSNADDLGEMFYNCTSLRSLKTGTWVYSEQLKADGYYPAFPVNMKDSTSGNVYNANTSIPELSNRTYVHTDESVDPSDDPDPDPVLPISYYNDVWNFKNPTTEDLNTNHYEVFFDKATSKVLLETKDDGSAGKLYEVMHNGERGEGGLCFGMALSVLSSFKGFAPVTYYEDSSNLSGYTALLAEVSKDSYNYYIKESAMNFIKTAHIYQYTADGQINKRSHKDDLNGLYEVARDFHFNGGEPVLISLSKIISLSDEELKIEPGHALAVLGISNVADDHVDIGVYDCNTPCGNVVMRLYGTPGNFNSFMLFLLIPEGERDNKYYSSENGYNVYYSTEIVQHFIDRYKSGTGMSSDQWTGIKDDANTIISLPQSFIESKISKIHYKEYIVTAANLWDEAVDDIIPLSKIADNENEEDYYENTVCWLMGNQYPVTFESVPPNAEIQMAQKNASITVMLDKQGDVTVDKTDDSIVIDGEKGSGFAIKYEEYEDKELNTTWISGTMNESVTIEKDGDIFTVTGAETYSVTDDEATDDPCVNGHTFCRWTTIKKSTELAAGQQSRKCSVCGKVETKTIDKLAPTLPAVKIANPKASKKAATVKWKKVSKKNQKKIAKIEIQYSLDKKFKTGVKTVYAKKSAVSKKITKLKSKKIYYVRIRAYKKSGGSVHISKWSTVKRVKAK